MKPKLFGVELAVTNHAVNRYRERVADQKSSRSDTEIEEIIADSIRASLNYPIICECNKRRLNVQVLLKDRFGMPIGRYGVALLKDNNWNRKYVVVTVNPPDEIEGKRNYIKKKYGKIDRRRNRAESYIED